MTSDTSQGVQADLPSPSSLTLRAYCPRCRNNREGYLASEHHLASWLTTFKWLCPTCNQALIHGQQRS